MFRHIQSLVRGTDKKAALYKFFDKIERIYDYFYEFASEALHIVIFENFVKSMTSCLSKLKVTPSFCFAFKIPDNPTASNNYYLDVMCIFSSLVEYCWQRHHDAQSFSTCSKIE